MWLLNTRTMQHESFVDRIPDYVILSHTWGKDEVAFEDVGQLHIQTKAGYAKVKRCCELAQKDGFDWAWIDTCCIDKRSSAELSEAINSMYSWYWRAAVCYAYLSDVHFERTWESHFARASDFEASRWFKRGWTLQELLAPEIVEFYDISWTFLGTKSKLVHRISRVTGIERACLLNRDAIKYTSTGTKFSWASLRETTRVEDMAYCLLGLCRVNMPMLYGEGERAFYRLQLEIIKQENGHSIFAWNPPGPDSRISTVLAPSPIYFEQAGQLRSLTSERPLEALTYDVTNNGLKITLLAVTVTSDRIVALLDCQDNEGSSVGVWLEKMSDGKYQRLPGSKLMTLKNGEEEDAELLTMFLEINRDHEENTETIPCQAFVSDVLTDGDCVVNGISVTSRDTSTRLRDIELHYVSVHASIRDDAERRQREQMRYLLQDFKLDEGQVAGLRLQYQKHENDLTRYETIPIILGMRKGRPVVALASETDVFRRHWADELRSNTSGEWDLVHDFYNGTNYDTTVQVEAKKKRVGMTGEKKMEWTIVIKVARCTCDSSSSDTRDDSECRCLDYKKLYRPDFATKPDTNPINHDLRPCIKCFQAVTETNIWLQRRLRVCRDCRYAMIEELQLVDEVSGLHFLECPCYTCEHESKIEWRETMPEKSVARLPWYKRVRAHALSKKPSGEF